MSDQERKQTTKGIWLSNNKKQGEVGAPGRMADNILVMDVEGTDGRERGEDQDFERKSALFALATSEVLIVNIWEHQVGLYQGANMGLLKTVFEVNLQLFLKDKQCVLFLPVFFVSHEVCANQPIVLAIDPYYSSSSVISSATHHLIIYRRHYWKISVVFGTQFRSQQDLKKPRYMTTSISSSMESHTRLSNPNSL